MTGLTVTSLASGSARTRTLLAESPCGAIELERQPLGDLPYRDLVRALLRAPGFKLDFRGQPPGEVLAMVAHRMLGPGVMDREAAMLAEEIVALSDHARAIVGGPPPQLAIRTYLAPGDLVWHRDRVGERAAIRLVWPLGRPAGMRVTPADNIDADRYLGFMRREHPLLCQLDTRVLRTGAPVETLWAHRPEQLAALRSGDFPFVRDPGREHAVTPGAASIHWVQTPAQPGAWHRSDWANRASPGLQIVVTAVAD